MKNPPLAACLLPEREGGMDKEQEQEAWDT
jgi:hypothetical protein